LQWEAIVWEEKLHASRVNLVRLVSNSTNVTMSKLWQGGIDIKVVENNKVNSLPVERKIGG
jgi:hypothetical protein